MLHPLTLGAVQWSQGITDAWSQVSRFVPKLFAFLVILLVGYMVVKLIAKALDSVLTRVGFDKAVERGGVKKALAKSKYDASDLVSKVAFYALFLLVLQAAFGVFGTNPVSLLIAGVIAFLPKVIVAVVIVVVAASVAAAARELIQASLGGLSYGSGLANAAAMTIIAVGGFAALNQLQIATPIVNGLFYAILASVVGVTVIAVGGGGIKPMQARWESSLKKYDEEKPRMAEEAKGARERIDLRAQELRQKAQQEHSDGHGARGPRPVQR